MTTVDLDEEARIASDAVRGAQIAYELAVKRAFPPGRYVSYTHGNEQRLCEVIEVHGENLHVRGLSGKKYRISAYRALFK